MGYANKGLLALMFVVFESAFVSVAMGIGGAGIGAVSLLFYTSIVAIVVSAVLSYSEDRFSGLSEIIRNRKMLAALLVSGILGYAATQLLLTIGTLGSNPSESGILFRTYPLIVAALTPLTLKQRVSAKQSVGLLMGFASIIFVMVPGVSMSGNYIPTAMFSLGSAACLAVSILLAKRYSSSTSGFILLANIGSLATTLPLILALSISLPAGLQPSTILSIAFLGIVENGIGAVLFYYAYRSLDTSTVGNAMLAVPLLSVFASYLVAGTPLSGYYIASAIVLAAGIALQRNEMQRAPKSMVSKSQHIGMLIFDVTAAFANSYFGRRFASNSSPTYSALAIKIEAKQAGLRSAMSKTFGSRGCTAFTTSRPHKAIKPGELARIAEMLELGKKEIAIIGIGELRDVQAAFADFVVETNAEPAN